MSQSEYDSSEYDSTGSEALFSYVPADKREEMRKADASAAVSVVRPANPAQLARQAAEALLISVEQDAEGSSDIPPEPELDEEEEHKEWLERTLDRATQYYIAQFRRETALRNRELAQKLPSVGGRVRIKRLG